MYPRLSQKSEGGKDACPFTFSLVSVDSAGLFREQWWEGWSVKDLGLTPPLENLDGQKEMAWQALCHWRGYTQ